MFPSSVNVWVNVCSTLPLTEMFGHSSKDMDSALLQALGAVTVDFALLDGALDIAISWLLMPGDLDSAITIRAAERNMIVTAEMSYGQKVKCLASLAKHKWPESSLEIRDLSARLSDAEARRNQLVHSSYSVDRLTGETIRRKWTAKVRQGLNSTVETATPEQIAAYAESLRALALQTERYILRRMLESELPAAREPSADS